MREAFDLFDTDGGGSISTDEIKCLFKCFSIKKTNSEIRELVKTYDTDDSGELDFNEFVLMMGKILLFEEPCHELKESFLVFNSSEG